MSLFSGAGSLGEAVLELRADGNPLEADIAQARGRAAGLLGGISDMIGGTVKAGFVAAGAATIAGITGLVGLASTSIVAAIDSQKIEAQTDAVIASTKGVAGVTKDMVLGIADSLSKLTGVDDDAIQSAENLLLTFTGVGKDAFPVATKAVVDMATAMNGGAIPTQEQLRGQTIALGKALNDFSGYNALKKQGVSFSEEQTKLIAYFKETNDLAGYQKLVLAELEKEFGKAGAAAGNTFAGKMARLQTVLGNVQEKIGGALLPVVTDLLDKFLAFADSPQVHNATDIIVGLIDVFVSGKAPLGDWSVMWQKVADLFGGDVANKVQSFMFIVRDFLDILQGKQGAMDAFITGIGQFADLFGLNGAKIESDIRGILEWIGKLFDQLKAGDWEDAWNTFTSGIATAIEKFGPQAWNLATEWGGQFWDWLTNETDGVIPKAAGAFGGFVGKAAALVGEYGPGAWDLVTKWGGQFWDWLTNETDGVLSKAGTAFEDFKTKAATALAPYGPAAWNLVETWGKQFWDWLVDPQAGAIATAATELDKLSTAIDAWAKDEKTQKAMYDAGYTLVDWLINAIGNAFDGKEGDERVGQALGKLGMALLRAQLTFDKAKYDIGGKIGQGILDRLGEWFNENAPKLSASIYKWLNDAADDLLKKLNELAAKLGKGIAGAFDAYFKEHPLTLPSFNLPTLPNLGGAGTGGMASPAAFHTGGSGGLSLQVFIDGTEIQNALLNATFTQVTTMFDTATLQAQTD